VLPAASPEDQTLVPVSPAQPAGYCQGVNVVLGVAEAQRTSKVLSADAVMGRVQDTFTREAVVGVVSTFMPERGVALSRCCHGTPAPA